jgi:hypothetical protein
MSLTLERERELDVWMRGLMVPTGARARWRSSRVHPACARPSVAAAAGERQQRGFEVGRAQAQLDREWPLGSPISLLEPVLRRCSADEQAELLEGAARGAGYCRQLADPSGAVKTLGMQQVADRLRPEAGVHESAPLRGGCRANGRVVREV